MGLMPRRSQTIGFVDLLALRPGLSYLQAQKEVNMALMNCNLSDAFLKGLIFLLVVRMSITQL